MKTILTIILLFCIIGCSECKQKEKNYVWATRTYLIDNKPVSIKGNESAIKSYLKEVFKLDSEIVAPNEIVVEPPLDDPFWNRRRVDLVISMIEAKVTHEVNPRLKIRLRRIGEIAEELRMRRDAAEFEFAESMDKLRRFYDDYEDDFWKVEQ